jgi:membrane protein required for colicin V production
MLGPLTYLDMALIGLAGLSGLLAMYRGFTREVLSILSWVAAAATVVYFVKYHKPAAEQLAKQYLPGLEDKGTLIVQIVLGAVLFLIVLVVVHLITSRISDQILDSRIGMVDRVLGFLYGVVRGFVLIVIPFMFYEAFYPQPEKQVEWVSRSQSLDAIKRTSNVFKSMFVSLKPLLPQSKDEQQ